MPDANFLAQKMPDERFSRICKLAPVLRDGSMCTFGIDDIVSVDGSTRIPKVQLLIK